MSNSDSKQRILLTNCRVFGGANGPPVVQKEVLIEGDHIAFAGECLDDNIDGLQRMDLEGAWVFPGFCDAHLHMAAGGQSLGITDLAGMNREEVLNAIRAAFSKQFGQEGWLEAFNWDEKESCRLDARLLEEIVPSYPLIVHKRDLHGCCLNQSALTLIGVSRDSKDPDGGAIGRFADGSPNGMLYESAIGLIHSVRTPPDRSARRRFILSAQEYFISLGLTAVSEVLDSGNEEIYRDLENNGELKIDIDGWKRYENWDGISRPMGGERFRVETIKLFLDGSFGSRSAAMMAPFSDGTQSGNLIYSDADLRSVFKKVTELGWRLAIHAIGDRAVDQACRLLSELPFEKGFSGRIEHLQQLPDDGVRLVRESRALASMQPIHMLDDEKWLPELIGYERCRNSFIWKSLVENGVPIANGSDWPVATPDPLLGIHASINRAKYNELPNPLFGMGEALLPWQAIRAVTRGYAIASGRSEERGSIEVGKYADLTVVDVKDQSLVDWFGAEIKMTISRGEVLYSTYLNN